MLRHFNQLDVVGTVESPKEYLNTLSINVYRDDIADSPLHTIKITDHPFFMLPPMVMDGKTYTLHLESTLPTDQFSYRNPEISFVANTRFKHVKLNFKPTYKSMDAEMNQNTMAGLILAVTIIAMMFNYERIAPAIEYVFEAAGDALSGNGAADAFRRNKLKTKKI